MPAEPSVSPEASAVRVLFPIQRQAANLVLPAILEDQIPGAAHVDAVPDVPLAREPVGQRPGRDDELFIFPNVFGDFGQHRRLQAARIHREHQRALDQRARGSE